MSTKDSDVVTRSEIVSVVEDAKDAERCGDFNRAASLYRRSIRLVQRRYQSAGRSPVSLHEMKERHAATSQGLRSAGTSQGGSQ